MCGSYKPPARAGGRRVPYRPTRPCQSAPRSGARAGKAGVAWRRGLGLAVGVSGVVAGVVGDPQSPGLRPGLSCGLPTCVHLYIFWACGIARVSRLIPSESFSPGPRTAPGCRGMPAAGRTRPERSEPRIIAWSPVRGPACTTTRCGSRHASASMWRTSFAGTAISEAGTFTLWHAGASTCTSCSRRPQPRQPKSVSS